ncbi:phosphatase PAP2 family protein [Fimbriimonas ginsengisoli]|uniref:PAP2 family protein n=1 Tax=Fimbriimonas ginsengisoli Gsoil 348 TaxID=661478 RepID=A0A068NUN1_FIMGI|nr:phosphatase PAP2 family protein [Fimbriimonas ginsengisoli]AIE87037.1 PAP2 family protein [Fimbriimonas ginsengisoli Gsoil 348]
MADLNRQLFHAINGWPESLAPTMRFFSEATSLLWVKLVLGALVIALIAKPGRTRRAGAQALLGFLIANGFTDLFKHGLPMHRPFQEIAGTDMVLRGGWSASAGTASAHSANMAVVAFVFVYHLGWWGFPWVLVALITGLSRVYNGVHYPYQVLLGWTCGVVAGLLVTKGWELIQRKRGSVLEVEDGQKEEAARKLDHEIEPA